MKYYINAKDVELCGDPNIQMGHDMLSEKQGCVNGCCSGLVYSYTSEYPTPAIHDDQEGFIIIEGSGWAKVGDQEFRLEPDVSFIVPKGVAHCVKKDPDIKHMKYFYFHAAV